MCDHLWFWIGQTTGMCDWFKCDRCGATKQEPKPQPK